jgi:NDP-sugar pyrophosphorylase family protein
MDMKALILAAGKGTRISQLTNHCPKPMLPVQDRPLLEHLVNWLRAYGICEIAINLHHLPAVIPAYFGDGRDHQVSLTYSYEAELMGTAGAAKRLASFLQESFVVLYGDLVTNVDLGRLIAFHQAHQQDGQHALLSLALYRVLNPTACGLVDVDTAGRVLRFVEKPAAHEVFTDLANTGILVCEPEVLEQIPAETVFDFGRDLLPRLLDAGQPVFGLEIGAQEYVIDIGTPHGYACAQQSWLPAERNGQGVDPKIGGGSSPPIWPSTEAQKFSDRV